MTIPSEFAATGFHAGFSRPAYYQIVRRGYEWLSAKQTGFRDGWHGKPLVTFSRDYAEGYAEAAAEITGFHDMGLSVVEPGTMRGMTVYGLMTVTMDDESLLSVAIDSPVRGP